MVWTDTHPAAWAMHERLKSSDLTNYLQNLLRDQAPRFIDGSSHTPLGIVRVLGTVGMQIATLRGETRITADGSTPASLVVGNTALTDSNVSADSVTAVDIEHDVAIEVTVNVPLIDEFLVSAGYWTESSSAGTPYGRFFTQQNSSPSVPLIAFTVPVLPTGCTITKAAMLIDGSGGAGSHGSLPANRPSLELAKVDGTTRAKTAVATVTDAPANVAAYETLHWVETTAFSHAYDRAAEYELIATGESGANSVMNALTIHAMRVTYSSARANR